VPLGLDFLHIIHVFAHEVASLVMSKRKMTTIGCILNIASRGFEIFSLRIERECLIGPLRTLLMVLVLLKLFRKIEKTSTLIAHRRSLIEFISHNDVHFLGLNYVFFYYVISSMVVIYRAVSFHFILGIIEAYLSAGLSLDFLVAAVFVYLADLRWLS